MNAELIAANRAMEQLWRDGKIPWAIMDWWLRMMCGV
jgi:hypothetical protein